MTRAASPLPGGLAEDQARLGVIGMTAEVAVPGRLHQGDVPVARYWVDLARLDRDRDAAGDGASIRGLARSRAAGATAAGLLADARAAIAASDDSVQAWVELLGAAADRDAAKCDEIETSATRGPLDGVPVGVKDVLDVAGAVTRAGSRQFADRPPAAVDAAAVAVLRAAGAVIVGKTRTHEFAAGGMTPPTNNPHDLARIPGGSSGGSAAAVAAGHVRLALGSDTGGSVRIPSSYCGTVGLVPSPGLLGTSGVVPLAWSLDRVGLITASVDDLALTAFALGIVRAVPTAPVVEGLRIGVPTTAFDEPIDPAVAEVVQTAMAALVAQGAVLVSVEIPHDWAAVPAGMTIIVAESADYHRARRVLSPELFGDDVLAQLRIADETTAADYVRAQRIRALVREEMMHALAGVDVLMMPTMPCVAPRWDEVVDGWVPVGGTPVTLAQAHMRYNMMSNLAALPCGTVPVGADARGLPIGLQAVAAPGRDDAVVSALAAADAAVVAAGSSR